jgi:hypothetical protein
MLLVYMDLTMLESVYLEPRCYAYVFVYGYVI